MAFQVERIHPLDLQPRKAVGVSLPFSSTSVFNSTYTTQDALKSNLINFLLTEKSERFLNLDLGAGLRAILFDQLTEDKVGEIEGIIRSGIADWFPNVVINSIQVQGDPDRNAVTVLMRYSVKFTNIQDQLVINFEQ